MLADLNCHAARVGIFLIAVALVAGTVGCGSFVQSLTIDSTDGGSVITPGEGTFRYFATMCCASDKLVAEADEGYRFVEWTGDGYCFPDNPDAAITWIIIPPGHSHVTAHFWPECTPMVAAGGLHTVGLKDSGRIFAVGDNSHGQCNVGGWRGITRVAAGDRYTVGLNSNNTVVAVGFGAQWYSAVGNWTDIIQVAAGGSHTAGLRSNGTVVAVGNNDDGQCDVGDWAGIIQVAAGDYRTVGLKSNGAVVATGSSYPVDDWTDIVQVAAGGYPTAVGLRSNGTVVCTGAHGCGGSNTDWISIIQVAAGYDHTVGLRSDGTVVAAGSNYGGSCDVDDWMGIVQVSAGAWHTVGLKSDGTIVAAGFDGYNTGPCQVGWMLIS
jgi:hypothetical protein